jgi:transcription elongation factor GreA
MSPNEGEKPGNLNEAAIAFLASLSAAKRETVTPAVMNFVRWYGGSNSLDRLSPPKLAEYAEGQAPGEEGASKLKAVRELLAYATKNEWTKSNLGVHLKA